MSDRSFVYEPFGSWVQDWAGRVRQWIAKGKGRTYISEESLDENASACV